MSEFDEYSQGRTTPYQQESSGAQTNNQRNAVARIESCPRLPAHTGLTVATLDSDVKLRYGTGLLHASPDCHLDGRSATGDVRVVGKAHDPCPADVDENHNQKWLDDDMCGDAWDGSRQAQSRPAGAVAFKEAGFTNPEIFRRGWESAWPPSPELPPKMDDGKGQNATVQKTDTQFYFWGNFGNSANSFTVTSRNLWRVNVKFFHPPNLYCVTTLPSKTNTTAMGVFRGGRGESQKILLRLSIA